LFLGLFAGYLTQNLFELDTLMSYIAFFTVLAFIHTRIRHPLIVPWPLRKDFKLNSIVKYGVITPALCFCCVFYLTRMLGPQFLAARDIMTSYKNTADIKVCYALAHRALDRSNGDFGHQEALEYIFQVVGYIYKQKELPQNEINLYVNRTLVEAKTFLNHNPQNAKMHYSFALFAIAISDNPLANQEFEIARQLSPKRQLFIVQQAVFAMAQENYHTARTLFKVAYDLDNGYKVPLQYYNMLEVLDDGEDDVASSA